MTVEQAVYKMLKYFCAAKYQVTEEEPNQFVTTFSLKLDVEAYNRCFDKKIRLNFNDKSAMWSSRNFSYSESRYIDDGGNLNWNDLMPILHSTLDAHMKYEIEHKLLRAEQERTKKVRELRVACVMKRELEAIKELTI